MRGWQMLKAVLFDFDDTLGDREEYAYGLYRDVLKEYTDKLTASEAEAMIQRCLIWDQFGNTNKRYVQGKLKEYFDIDLGYDLDDYWENNLWRYAVLFPDAMDTLQELKKTYKIGVITNGNSYGQNKKLQVTGVDKVADLCIVSGDTPYRKPQPEIFRMAAEGLGVECSECAFVGDAYFNDMLGAARAGMYGIWYWPHGKRLHVTGEPQISSLSELPELLKTVM